MSGKDDRSGTYPPLVSGVYPHLAVVAGRIPRTETGIGALMPWADRLWFGKTDDLLLFGKRTGWGGPWAQASPPTPSG